MHDAIIIGAGITGLTCGWRLQKLGFDVLVLESRARPGGVIQTEQRDGYMVEWGPNSLLPTPESSTLIEDLGLSDDVVTAPPRAPRYIYFEGKLRAVPLGLMSAGGMLRLLGEPFVRSRSPADETVSDFFCRRAGRQAHDRLVAPFVTGIYAGDTRHLSMAATFPRLVEVEKTYGSLVMGMLRSPRKKTARARISSFRNGMATLPLRLAQDLNVVYEADDVRVSQDLEVDWAGGHATAKTVIVTTPAHRTLPIVERCIPEIGRRLETVEYAPMVVAAAAYPNTAFPSPVRGFGFLVPRSERLHILGTLFSSALFPGRAPAGLTLLTSFIGGAHEPAAINWSDDRIGEVLDRELRTTMHVRQPPGMVRLIRQPQAIPQYNVGYERWAASVRAELKRTPGLFLTGSYLDGISVPSCIESAGRTAHQAADFIRRKT